MRITLFTEVFLPKIDGVVTRVTRTLDQLAELGHEVQVIAPRYGADDPDSYAGSDVIRVPSLAFPAYPEVRYGFGHRGVDKQVRAFAPDVIHAVNPVWLAGYGVLASRRLRVPLVASFHTNVPEYTTELGIGWLRAPAQRAIPFLHSRAAVNLCTSGPMVDKARGLGMPNVRLWPKAVDTVSYHPSRRTTRMRELLSDGDPAAPLVVYIGRISPEKNLALLGEVMPVLRERVPGARLALVGSGPGVDDLRSRLDPAWSTFTGYLSGADLAAAFASGDVFVFPSHTETLGLVALESMASGVPVVGARAGGIPFVIDDHETGILVDADASPGDWAGRLAEVLTDPSLRERLSTAGRAEAERHSWRESTLGLVRAYEDAIMMHP